MKTIEQEDILFDEEPHTYTYRGRRYNSVTQIIREAGMGDDFSTVSPLVMAAAQERGRLVHKACAMFDEVLDIEECAPAVRPYVEAYFLFRKERKLMPIAVEQRMVSPSLQVAGTPDLVCWMEGRRVVIDHKTSQTMSKSMGLQTAGYKIIWNDLRPMSPIHERYGLRLEKTGRYKLVPHEDTTDEVVFMDLLNHSCDAERIEKWRRKYGSN